MSCKLLALGVANNDGQLMKERPVGEPSLPLTGQHRGTSMPHLGFEPGPVDQEADMLSSGHRATTITNCHLTFSFYYITCLKFFLNLGIQK